MSDQSSVSLLGLGRMGAPMARNLARSLPDLTVWNRTIDRADALRSERIRVALTPREAACDLTLTVLTDLGDVEQVLDGPDGLVAGWHERRISNPVLVVHGTVSPVRVVQLGHRLAADGIALVDAPLSGGVAGAESASLSIMVGGARHDVARLLPIFEAMGDTVLHLGDLGSGQLAKACNQIVVASTIAAISEALVLADSGGLDRSQLLTVLAGGLAASEVLTQKRDRWTTGDFAGGGSSVNQLKDLNFVTEAAASRGLSLRLAEVVREYFTTAVQIDGAGALDHSALVLSIARHSESHR